MSGTNGANLTLFFGHFHPLLVHLPIGFLTLLVVLEVADRIHHLKHAAQARGMVLFLTVASSIVTVACGLMLSSSGDYEKHLLSWHKWMGISLTIAVCLTAVGFWGKHHRLYIAFLMATLLLLGPASHFGGSLTHGSDYLTEYAPAWVRAIVGKSSPPIVVKPRPVDPSQSLVFGDVVQPILTQNCASCHGAEKLKGDLRLDTFEGLSKGGASGAALMAGDSRNSLLVHRLLLPPDDPKHMPPAGKPQPTDEQLALIQWWIDAGASADKTVRDLNPPRGMNVAIAGVLGFPPPRRRRPRPRAWILSRRKSASALKH